MSDLTITAANVVADSDATIEWGTAGEAITAGQVVYRDSTTAKYMKADNNSATAEAKVPRGVALNGAAANQPLAICTRGSVTIGATLSGGVAYYLSDTAGGICPVADLGTGETATILGISTSTTKLKIDIQPSGVTL